MINSDSLGPVETQLVLTVLKNVAGEAIKLLFKKDKPVKSDDRFLTVVLTTARQLRYYYRDQIQIDLSKTLTEQEVLEELRSILLGIESLDANFWTSFVEKNNLPSDFQAILHQFLIIELLREPEFVNSFKLDIIQYKNDLIEKNTSETSGRVLNIENQLSQVLSHLERTTISPQILEARPPQRLVYTSPSNYIPRNIKTADPSIRPVKQSFEILSSIVQRDKRVTLLSSAGLGKSSELRNLASIYSKEDAKLFPVVIKLKLYSTEEIENLIEKSCRDWRRVPPSDMLLIFDGLDEIPDKEAIFFVRKLLSFCEQEENESIRIVVSCRSNFYHLGDRRGSGTLDGFTAYFLTDLDISQAAAYCNQVLGSETSDQLMNELYEKRLQALTQSPFFISIIVELFKADRKLPNSKKDLFELVIRRRIAHDQEHHQNKEVDIRDHELEIRETITKIALYMTIIGKNVITEEDIQQLIRRKPLRDLIKQSFLFNRDEEKQWTFEHNNFQEYLASKAILDLGFSEIIKLISFEPNYVKIRPSWVNTVSFLLMNLRDDNEIYKDLIKWITENEPNLAVLFEREYIDLETRENIVIAILEFFHGKNILTRSEYFDLKRLGMFVQDSDRIVDYLLKILQFSEIDVAISEAALILPYLNNYKSKLTAILSALILRAKDENLSMDSRRCCLYAISDIGGTEMDDLDLLITNRNLIKNQYARAGLYLVILKSGYAEHYIDWLLSNLQSKFSRIRSDFDELSEVEPVFGDESINLIECLRSVTSLNGLVKIIDKAKVFNDREDSFDFGVTELIKHVIVRSSELYPYSKEIFQNVLDLHVGLSRSYRTDFRDEIRRYYSVTGNSVAAFKHLLEMPAADDNESTRHINLASEIADQECIDLALESYRDGLLNESIARGLLICLNYNRSSLLENYYNRLNELSNNKFLLNPPKKSYREILHEKYEQDVSLLLDASLFIAELRGFFELEGVEIMTLELLDDFRREQIRDQSYGNEIIPTFMRNLAMNSPVSLEESISFINDAGKWNWFRIYHLIDYDAQNKIVLPSNAIEFIKKWVIDSLREADFRGAYWIKDSQEWQRHTDHYIAYSIQHFDIEVDDSVMLQLFWIDSMYLPRKRKVSTDSTEPEAFIDFLIRKVGRNGSISQVLANLKQGHEVEHVIMRHLRHCRKLHIVEALPLVLENINLRLGTSNIVEACEVYLSLGGSPSELENLCASLPEDEYVRFSFISLFKGRTTAHIISFVESLLRSDLDIQAKERYSTFLVKEGVWSGLEFIVEQTKTHHRFPTSSISYEGIQAMNSKKALPLLVDLLEESYKPGFQHEFASDVQQTALTVSIDIATRNDVDYQWLKKKMLDFIADYDMRYLYYQLEILEKKNDTRRSRSYSHTEAIAKLSAIGKAIA